MYRGKIVEIAETEDLFNNPQHPYTKALLSAVPVTHPKEEKSRVILKGEVPSPANPPSGCTFHPRCPFAMEICKSVIPESTEFKQGHTANCHLYTQNEEEITYDISHS
jgi:oligopeptide transport system ATP-binding protein